LGTKTSPDVQELVQAWSPIFSQVGSIVLTTDKGFKLLDLAPAGPPFLFSYGLQVITWENDEVLPTGIIIFQQYLEDLEELAGYIRKANPKGLPTYWTLATEFSYWRLPADTIIGQLLSTKL